MANNADDLLLEIDHRQAGEAVGVEEFDDFVPRRHGLYLYGCTIAELAEQQFWISGDYVRQPHQARVAIIFVAQYEICDAAIA